MRNPVLLLGSLLTFLQYLHVEFYHHLFEFNVFLLSYLFSGYHVFRKEQRRQLMNLNLRRLQFFLQNCYAGFECQIQVPELLKSDNAEICNAFSNVD